MARDIQQNNPEELYKQMYCSDPRFKQFVDENKGMSLKSIAQKYGIPL